MFFGSRSGRRGDKAMAAAMSTLTAPEVLRVASDSQPGIVAGAIAQQVRRHHKSVLQVIGAGAVNQAVKAIAIARRYLLAEGVDIACTPSFVDTPVNGRTLTAIRFDVLPMGD